MTRSRRRGGLARLAVLPVLAVVLAAGAAVRFAGSRHGEPSGIFHPDVLKQIHVARSAYDGSPDPTRKFGGDDRHRLYPYGASMLLAASVRAAEATGLYRLVRGGRTSTELWLWDHRLRLFSIATSLVALAAVVLWLGPRLGPAATLLTGCLLALEPWNAYYAHYGMNDVPLVAAMLLAWLATLRAAEGGRAARLVFGVLAGLAFGLGFGIKYQAVLVLVVPLLVVLSVLRDRGVREAALLLAALGAGFVAGALDTMPYFVAAPIRFAERLPTFLAWQTDISGLERSAADKIPYNLATLASMLAERGIWAMLPGAAAGVATLRWRDGENRLAIATAAAVVVAVTAVFVVSRDFIRSNDLQLLLPFVILLGGLALAPPAPAGRRAALFVLGLVALAIFARESSEDALSLARLDTRVESRFWCRREIPAGSRVLREAYSPTINRGGVREKPTRSVFLLPDVRRRLRDFDWVITSSLAHERYFREGHLFHERAARAVYDRVEREFELVAEFRDPHPTTFGQPHVRIYRRR